MSNIPFGIYEKLQKIQAELKVPKANFNSFGKYSYRSAEDILEAVKPLLSKYGLVLILDDSVSEVGNRVYVYSEAKLYDTNPSPNLKNSNDYDDDCLSATGFARESETKKGMDDSQITGTASSYARKYALNGLFLIDDTKDADSDEYRNEAKERQAQAKPTPAVPAATQAQREAINRHMVKLGIAGEEMPRYLKEHYNVDVPLTKDGAAKVIDSIILESEK
jgi:hypothetical protein